VAVLEEGEEVVVEVAEEEALVTEVVMMEDLEDMEVVDSIVTVQVEVVEEEEEGGRI